MLFFSLSLSFSLSFFYICPSIQYLAFLIKDFFHLLLLLLLFIFVWAKTNAYRTKLEHNNNSGRLLRPKSKKKKKNSRKLKEKRNYLVTDKNGWLTLPSSLNRRWNTFFSFTFPFFSTYFAPTIFFFISVLFCFLYCAIVCIIYPGMVERAKLICGINRNRFK